LEQPFALAGGITAQIGASVGVAVAPADGTAVDTLVRRADVALHRAKSGGRGRFHFFEPGMDAQLRDRAELEADLRRAIAADLIVPHFQPLVQLDSGRPAGFEMLARWPHPTRGMVPPSEFVAVAEEIGLIGPMTERLLRRACRAAASWPAEVVLACNISPLQLRDRDLPRMVRTVLAETGLPAPRLELELTENALVGDLALAREVLAELKVLGLRLALDDFGTGHSSLRHLQALPFDKIKIDAGFVRSMVGNPESGKIVAAVIGLGHSLGLPTVTEGVENAGTAALLRGLGCDLGQGWLCGRPGPEDGVGTLLAASAA
jgi:predicted signal transduction protein with EAL and GGDEF domain